MSSVPKGLSLFTGRLSSDANLSLYLSILPNSRIINFVLELFGTNILLHFHSKSELIGDILICWKWKLLFNMTILQVSSIEDDCSPILYTWNISTVRFVKRIIASAKHLKILRRTKCYEIGTQNLVKFKSKRKLHIQLLVKSASNSSFCSGNYFLYRNIPIIVSVVFIIQNLIN